jgi:hypothetical protein
MCDAAFRLSMEQTKSVATDSTRNVGQWPEIQRVVLEMLSRFRDNFVSPRDCLILQPQLLCLRCT